MSLRPRALLPALFVLLLLLLITAAGQGGPAPEPTSTAAAPQSPSAVDDAHAGHAPTQTVPDPVVVGTRTTPGRGQRYGLFGTRWNPCQPITYRVNYRGGYRGALADIQRAFRTVGAATGMTFVYQGTTRRVSFRTARDPRVDITVSWATPGQVARLGGPVAGLANTVVSSHDGVWENLRGSIAFDSTQVVRGGYALSGPPTWGQAFLHEIGHIVGLDHVRQRTQVMYPAISRYNHVLGAGDLLRLFLVGRAAGCIVNSQR